MNTSLASTDAAIASNTTTPIPYAAQQPVASTLAANDGRWWRAPKALRAAYTYVVKSVRSLGPYLAIEIILPGGSIIALALWTYRRRRAARDSANAVSTAVVPVVRRAPRLCVTPCTQQ